MKWSIAIKHPEFVDKSPEEIRNRQAAEVEKKRVRKGNKRRRTRAEKNASRKELRIKQNKIDDFYDSWDWKELRYEFLKEKKRRCECCGAQPSDGIRIVVDHIKPIRHNWNLRLQKSNLQMLCDDCNRGKGSRDETDWRGADDIALSILSEMKK